MLAGRRGTGDGLKFFYLSYAPLGFLGCISMGAS